MLIDHSLSFLQPIADDFLSQYGVALYIKRDDLLHEQVSGNKWRKLKYNLETAQNLRAEYLLTFGGAYSNHLYAVAAAAKACGMGSIGIVRGGKGNVASATLSFAESCGMKLYYASRESYRHEKDLLAWQALQYWGIAPDRAWLLPEGGANSYAVRGCAEIIDEIEIPFQHIFTACGTGCTLAGITLGLAAHPYHNKAKAWGVSALKGGVFLRDDVSQLLDSTQSLTELSADNWELLTDYHFGGYAKTTPELRAFMEKFETQHGLLIEPIYTAKMLFALYDMVEKGVLPRGSTVIALHTGGLQGRESMLLSKR